MPQPLTSAQKRVYDHIREWAKRHGNTPTQTELAKACGFSSTNGVRTHLRALEGKGWITLERGKARSIRVLSAPRPHRELHPPPNGTIPLLGAIPAGPLAEAIESADEELPISPVLFRGTNLFALRVTGDSMRDAGIHLNDIAIIDRQAEVADGTIAAVKIDGEATLKRVMRSGGNLVLRPANQAVKEMVIEPDSGLPVEIIGKLVGIVRTEIR